MFLRSARYLRIATGLVVSVPTKCVLVSSPENVLFVLGITLKTWWGLYFTTTLTLLNSHKALTTSTYSWSACRRRASSLNASYDTSLYLAYQVGRYHLTRFSVLRIKVATLDAAVGFEPRLRGMSPVCFRCTTTAIYQSTLFLLSSLSSNKVKLLWVLSTFFCTIIITEFSEKVKIVYSVFKEEILVGVTGFEPTISCSQSTRHRPN